MFSSLARCAATASPASIWRRLSYGTGGADYDLVEAHRWFNLPAVGGNDNRTPRAQIADDMSARAIVTAQRVARGVIAASRRRAA